MGTAEARDLFEDAMERVCERYRFVVAGYVVMPEHFHLLIGEPRVSTLAVIIQVLKQQISRKLKRVVDAPLSTPLWRSQRAKREP